MNVRFKFKNDNEVKNYELVVCEIDGLVRARIKTPFFSVVV